MSVKDVTDRTKDAWASDLAVDVSDGEIEILIEPYIRREFEANDPEWRTLIATQEQKWRRAYWKSRLRAFMGLPPRGQKHVQNEYQRQWGGRTALDVLVPKESSSAVAWRDRGFLMDANGLKRIYLLYLMRLIEALNPRSVLEAGCGTGVNLFVLASRFPDIEFSGIELTAEGVESAQVLKKHDKLPEVFTTYSPLPPRDPSAHKRIRVRQASAAELPFEDGAFDLVFTCLALEQMKAVRDPALRELRRVSSQSAVMIEPFADWNTEGMRDHRIRAHAYFDAAVDDLDGFGFRPVFVSADIPAKIAMGVAIVAAAAV
jgi:SAM-dependent methyltransferase